MPPGLPFAMLLIALIPPCTSPPVPNMEALPPPAMVNGDGELS